MKRTISLVLCLLLLLCMTACAPNLPGASTAATTETTVATTAAQTQSIKNIILIIGDGTGLAQLEAGELCSGEEFVFRSWRNALVNTNSLDDSGEAVLLTDSAAAGTALATGTLTSNGCVGQDKDGKNLKTILDYAGEDYGKATGVVTTDQISGATPASFSSHCSTRQNTEAILTAQFYSNVTLLCGQKSTAALNAAKSVSGDYTVCASISEAEDNMDAEMAYWQLPLSEDLSSCINPALEYLSQDEDGFVLMIEQAHVDKFSHNNEFDGMQKCANDLNETVQTVLEWIGDRNDTAILITADHETGGLSVSADPVYDGTYTTADGRTVYYQWTTTDHTKTEVGVWAYGFEPHFEKYYLEETPGIIKNISVFEIMLDLLQNPQQ